jgi:hypothetical protein
VASGTLISRIAAETGVSIRSAADEDKLFGMFDRYRPHGAGLERLLSDQGIEGRVRARLQRVFDVTAPGRQPGDAYFVVRRYEPIDETRAVELTRVYLNGLQKLAEHMGNMALSRELSSLKIVANSPSGLDPDEDMGIQIYECVTDFLRRFQSERNVIFVLREGLYSMSADYFLAAYILWPAIESIELAPGAMEGYFDIWRHGVKLKYFANMVAAERPE